MRSTYLKKAAALFFLVAVVCSPLSGCSNKAPKPEDTIQALQKSINSFDMDGILACIDSEWASQVEKVLLFSVGEKGVSVGSYITLLRTIMPVLPYVTDGAIDSDKLPEVEFTVLKTDISDETAVVALAGILVWEEHTKPFAATIDMELQNEVWVVCGIR